MSKNMYNSKKSAVLNKTETKIFTLPISKDSVSILNSYNVLQKIMNSFWP